MQTVLVRASVLTKVYLANVVVLDVLSNPSDGSRTRRVVEVVELAVFAATVVVHVLTRYWTFQCVVVRASVWSWPVVYLAKPDVLVVVLGGAR